MRSLVTFSIRYFCLLIGYCGRFDVKHLVIWKLAVLTGLPNLSWFRGIFKNKFSDTTSNNLVWLDKCVIFLGVAGGRRRKSLLRLGVLFKFYAVFRWGKPNNQAWWWRSLSLVSVIKAGFNEPSLQTLSLPLWRTRGYCLWPEYSLSRWHGLQLRCRCFQSWGLQPLAFFELTRWYQSSLYPRRVFRQSVSKIQQRVGHIWARLFAHNEWVDTGIQHLVDFLVKIKTPFISHDILALLHKVVIGFFNVWKWQPVWAYRT